MSWLLFGMGVVMTGVMTATMVTGEFWIATGSGIVAIAEFVFADRDFKRDAERKHQIAEYRHWKILRDMGSQIYSAHGDVVRLEKKVESLKRLIREPERVLLLHRLDYRHQLNLVRHSSPPCTRRSWTRTCPSGT